MVDASASEADKAQARRHELGTVRTTDGWQLPLRRIGTGPIGTGSGVHKGHRHPRPVLMLHGFGANGFCMWRPRGPSLGGYLAARGFDAWRLDFRGTRDAICPGGRSSEAYTVDDKILEDVPAAVEAVLAATGAEILDVVGFSLGGAVLYGYLSAFSGAPVGRCVTMGSPLRFRLPPAARLASKLLATKLGRRALHRKIPIRDFCRLGLATNLVFPARPHFNLRNVERDVVLEMMRFGTEDPPLSEVAQLVSWGRGGRLVSANGAIDYERGLADLRTPLLLMAATADRHVPPGAIQQALDRLGCGEKKLIEIGKRSGAQMDYGHTDLLLGRRAEHEVFPHISAWLSRPA